MALITLIGEVIYYKKRYHVQPMFVQAKNIDGEIQQLSLDKKSVVSTSPLKIKPRENIQKKRKIQNKDKATSVLDIQLSNKNKVHFIK